jgi:DNA-binding IclR family transcriptional regulator
MAGNTSVPGASVTSRVLALLDAFNSCDQCLTLSELARRANLPLPTAHRLVGELTSWGALTRQPSGQYVVGRRLWEIGLLAPDRNGLRQLASPFLHDMYATTLATTILTVRDGVEAVNLDRLSGRKSVPIMSDVGSRVPLYATGVGKVLLAYAPQVVRTEVLANLERITPYTITQPGRLNEQLSRVRRDGFGQCSEEMKLGVCSVAVPIRAADGSVVAALGAVVPNLKRDRPRLIAALSVAAQGISRCIRQHPVVL